MNELNKKAKIKEKDLIPIFAINLDVGEGKASYLHFMCGRLALPDTAITWWTTVL
jgi:hypothetical protein